MKSKVLIKNDKEIVIDWSGPTGGGIVKMVYNGKGGYEIDAEYIGIDTLISVIKNLNDD